MFLVAFFVLCCFNILQQGSAKSISDDRIDLSFLGVKIFGRPIENDGQIFKGHSGNADEIGPYLEGDLLIPTNGRNGMKPEALRWKNGEVPFEIHGNFSKLLNPKIMYWKPH